MGTRSGTMGVVVAMIAAGCGSDVFLSTDSNGANGSSGAGSGPGGGSTSSSSGVGGQPAPGPWSKSFGGPGIDWISVGTDGSDIFITGAYSDVIDFGGGALPMVNGQTAFVARLDAWGNHLHSQSFAGDGFSVGTGVVSDGMGGCMLVGTYSGSFSLGGQGFPATSMGAFRFFVARFDESGAVVWSKTDPSSNSSAESAATSVTMVGGDVIVSGDAASELDLGGGPLPAPNGENLFVARFTLQGELVWARRYGGLGGEAASLAEDASGRILVAGRFDETMVLSPSLTLTSAGDGDAFVMQLDPASGDVLWAKGFGSEYRQKIDGIAGAANGDIALGGEFFGRLDFGDKVLSVSKDDAFVARLDPNGNHLWSTTHGPRDAEWLSVAFDANGRLAAGGKFETNMAQYTGTESDGMLSVWHADGSPVADIDLGGAGQQRTAVARYHDNRFLVYGAFEDTIDLGFGPLVSKGERDIYVAVWEP